MNRRLVIGIFAALLLVVGAVTVAGLAYNAGIAQGLADSGKLVIPEGGVAPYMYHMPFYYRGGLAFGFVRCLVPLLGIFLVFALVRGAFWRGGGWGRRGWGYGGHGMGGPNVPPMFDEWHKRAHGEPAPTPPEGGQPR